MKIVVKTVKSVLGEFEVTPEMTILQLKQAIAENQSITPDGLSLILKSKMLKDDAQTLQDLGVKDGDFIVVVIKKTAAPKPAAPKPAEPVQEEPKPTPQPAPAPVQPTPAPAPAPQTQPTQDPVNIFQAPTQPQQPTAMEPSDEAIALLVGMGFDREASIKALRKAGNNSEIAANFLLEGVDLDRIPDPHQRQGGAGAHPQGGMGMGMQFPSKEEFVEQYREDPEPFEPILQSLDMTNPALGQFVRSNPEALYDLIKSSLAAQQQAPEQPTYQPTYQQPPQAAPQQPRQQGIALSQEDQDAIARLEQLGFTKQQALQAYIACDKNEMLAANFLLDGGMF